MKFGVLDIGLFADLTIPETKVVEATVTETQAAQVVEALKSVGAIDKSGAVVDTLKPEEIKLPEELEPVKEAVIAVAKKAETVSAASLANVTVAQTVAVEREATQEEKKELIQHFVEQGYADKKTHKKKDTLKNALESGTLNLPERYEAARERVENILKKDEPRVPVRDASRDVVVRLNKQVVISPEFQALWDKIKYKTRYCVDFDENELIRKSADELRRLPAIPKARVVTTTAEIDVKRSGIGYTETSTRTIDIEDVQNKLPDFLRMTDEECFISRKAYIQILRESGRMRDFLNNPQKFMELFIETVKTVLHDMEIEGIRYTKLEGEEYYFLEVFDNEELPANLDVNAVAVKNSAYDYIIYDSTSVERPFAVALDNDPDVKMFFKIPKKFKIETPIGTYNPDWAVYMDKDGVEKLYFVIETKGTTKRHELRTPEQQKIHCGERHFEAISDGAEFREAKSWREFKIGV